MVFKRQLLHLLFVKKTTIMELTLGNQSTSRRSKRQVLALLSEYDKSHGMSVKDFCRLHQISEGAFYSSRKRHRSASKAKTRSSGFIAIASPTIKDPANTLFAEVNGIKLYRAVPATYLKTLIL